MSKTAKQTLLVLLILAATAWAAPTPRSVPDCDEMWQVWSQSRHDEHVAMMSALADAVRTGSVPDERPMREAITVRLFSESLLRLCLFGG